MLFRRRPLRRLIRNLLYSESRAEKRERNIELIILPENVYNYAYGVAEFMLTGETKYRSVEEALYEVLYNALKLKRGPVYEYILSMKPVKIIMDHDMRIVKKLDEKQERDMLQRD